MFDKLYLGQNVSNLDLGKEFGSYTEVVFNFEDDYGEQKTVLWGDETGQILELTMPVLTDAERAEEIAKNVLNALNSGQCKPYAASEAMIDPAFQLGDAVTLPGLYTVIGTADELCDSLYSADISAKGRDETDDEFIYKSQSDKNIQRQLVKTRTSFKIRTDGISARVDGLDDDFTALDLRVDGLTSEVRGKIDGEEAMTLIEQGIDNIRLYASGEDGIAYISIYQGGVEIDGDSFVVNVDAANINGLLRANQIDTDGLTVGRLGDDNGDYAEMDSDGFYVYTQNSLKFGLTVESNNKISWQIGRSDSNPFFMIKEYYGGRHTFTIEDGSGSNDVWIQLDHTNQQIIMNAPNGLYFNGRRIAT